MAPSRPATSASPTPTAPATTRASACCWPSGATWATACAPCWRATASPTSPPSPRVRRPGPDSADATGLTQQGENVGEIGRKVAVELDPLAADRGLGGQGDGV